MSRVSHSGNAGAVLCDRSKARDAYVSRTLKSHKMSKVSQGVAVPVEKCCRIELTRRELNVAHFALIDYLEKDDPTGLRWQQRAVAGGLIANQLRRAFQRMDGKEPSHG